MEEKEGFEDVPSLSLTKHPARRAAPPVGLPKSSMSARFSTRTMMGALVRVRRSISPWSSKAMTMPVSLPKLTILPASASQRLSSLRHVRMHASQPASSRVVWWP